jgi:hypothetical protein
MTCRRRGRRAAQQCTCCPGVFKLLGGASDVQQPPCPSQLYLAIASIFSFTIGKIKESFQPNRPYVNIQIGPSMAAALYDSGADISCMSETEFRRIPVDHRPKKLATLDKNPCFSAGGTPLTVTGIYNISVSVLGRKTEHPFRVIKGLNESVILGADFINKHLLMYDPKFKQVKWRHDNDWTVASLCAKSDTVIPEYSSRLLRVKVDDNGKTATSIIAEISCPEWPYLVGGPGLMSLDEQKGGLVEILNTGPEPVTIARGQVIGQADNVANQSLVPFEAEAVNRIAKEQWKKKQGSSPRATVTEEFRQMCRLEVPSQHEADYRQLLAKHRGIFSLNKNEIGYCDTFFHKLFMKTEEPVYVRKGQYLVYSPKASTASMRCRNGSHSEIHLQ